jgi:LPXTG-motif cell wall-anchored protein
MMDRKKLAGFSFLLGLVCVTLTARVEAQSYPIQTGELTVSSGGSPTSSLQAGQSFAVAGGGFNPSTTVTITIDPSGAILGTATTDATGAFSATVSVPSSLSTGSYTVRATGAGPSGTLVLSQAVTVQGAASGLPVTGSSSTIALLIGISLLAAGALLVTLTRRSRLA